MSHQCPRPECSRTVEDDQQFACRGDWYALPKTHRDAIWNAFRSGDGMGHIQAMADAIEWYRDNPPRYATQPGMVARRQRPR
jgi:hypothetical protein